VETMAQKEPVDPPQFMPVYRQFLELIRQEHPTPAPKAPAPKKRERSR
jgi:hypothetical protein